MFEGKKIVAQDAETRDRNHMLLCRGSSWSVCFLPSTFLLISGSGFGATFHDAAHDAFMTLPPYSSTKEDDMQSAVSGTMRHPAGGVARNRSAGPLSEEMPSNGVKLEQGDKVQHKRQTPKQGGMLSIALP